MGERTMIGSSTFLAALMIAAAGARMSAERSVEARAEPTTDMAPTEPPPPANRQQRRHAERMAAKAARRKTTA